MCATVYSCTFKQDFFSTVVFQVGYFLPSTTFREERCCFYFLQVPESQLVYNKI